MKTITIYELFRLIKDSKQPKEIKYNGYLLSWDNANKDYYCEEYGNLFTYLFTNEQTTLVLEEKVEILEDKSTQEETKEYINKLLEVWELVKKQFSKLFDEITRIDNDLNLIDNNFNLEDKSKEEKKIPEKLESYYDVGLEENCIYEEGKRQNNVILGEPNSWGLIIDKINEIIDYLHYLKSKGE